jgi:hypothetical protein
MSSSSYGEQIVLRGTLLEQFIYGEANVYQNTEVNVVKYLRLGRSTELVADHCVSSLFYTVFDVYQIVGDAFEPKKIESKLQTRTITEAI